MSRQFDVHSNIFGDDPNDPPFLVNLQSDHLELLRKIVVAPLRPVSGLGVRAPIHVPIRFERTDYWLSVSEIAFVRNSSLGPIMGNVAADRDRIIRGLDLLFTGI